MRGGWLSVAGITVLIVSLGLKLAVQEVNVGEDQGAAVRALADGLARQGYRVSLDRLDLPIVRGQRAGCTLTVRVLDPHGTYRDTELRKLPPGWSVAYAWRGRWYEQQPRLGPLLDYYTARELARLGRSAIRAPVLMTLNQRGCPLPDPALLDIGTRLRRITRAM